MTLSAHHALARLRWDLFVFGLSHLRRKKIATDEIKNEKSGIATRGTQTCVALPARVWTADSSHLTFGAL